MSPGASRSAPPAVWLAACPGARVVAGDPPAITGVTHDSRRVEPGFLFVAIPGYKTDGHAFVPDALARGAAAVLAQEDRAHGVDPGGACMVTAPDTRAALAPVSAAFWGRPARQLAVIGVTGTDGKTTTTHLIAHVLGAAGIPAGLLSGVAFCTDGEPRLNATHMTTVEAPDIQAGLAEMVASRKRAAVLEASSHGLALHRLDACDFDVGVFTNLTGDHLDFHQTIEAYRDAKARLFEMVASAPPKPFARRAAVLNAADPASEYMASRCPGVPVYRYALDPAAPFHARDVEAGPDGTAFELVTPGGRARCRLRLLGLHNVENALAAAAVAASQGVGVASIAQALSSFESVPGRLEPIDEGQPFRVFVDIASTPEAFRKVLEVLRPATEGELIVVFGAAGERDRNRRFGMGAVAAALADFAVLTNEDPRSEDPEAIIDDIARSMIDAGAAEGERFVRVTDRREAIALACARARPGDTVLLAGKGAEQAIDLRDGSIPWDERTVARDVLRGLRTPAGQVKRSEPMSDLNPESLLAYDRSHLLHPLFHPSDQADAVLLVRGEGSTLYDAAGKAYLDGLACLWNVAVGHGRRELAEAAREQMETLAFANGYTGYANVPAIRLAERILGLAYPNMSAVFFANSGSEAVELAVKTARFYWFASGKPDKVKIIVRREAYHGGTIAATAATGMAAFHRGFGPLAEGFVRAETCYPYRCKWCSGEEACNLACADDIEAAIQREGPETVAAVLAEPVHGAGGVIPPTPGYWPRLREICDRHDVLLIADEVITGFGRTGRWFALEHWDTRPDLMTFAKAVTSAYVPLSGVILSDRVHRAFLSLPPDLKFMHGYTNSAHPTACAVGLRNLDIMEREGLVQRAEAMGARLRAGLEALRGEEHVGDVRGLGLMCAVELVADKATRQPFDPALGLGPRLFRMMRERGLLTRTKGESILLAPPLVITEAEIDRIVDIVGSVVREVRTAVASRA